MAATSVNRLGLTPTMLNHAAYVTHDAAATVEFYTQVLGMELASTLMGERIPSTGDAFPYFHLFFRLGDGSTMAFFESPGLPPAAPASHPAYEVFNHIAFQVDSVRELERWREWLAAKGVAVTGPIDHEGMVLSIYFRDNNGHRLELTTPLDKDWNRHGDKARRDLESWLAAKEKARREGRDVREALLELIRAQAPA
jgi:catechol 2,3-dioxygenase-like lactoylglutathione lyase family enzyme